jgi:elongation factor P
VISVNDLKPGVTIELDGQVYQVVESEHHKPGKGQAVVRTRLRDVRTQKVFNKTFTAQVKVPKAHVNRRDVQYLYSQGDMYCFMDTETYEQIEVLREKIDDAAPWLKEGETVHMVTHEGELLGLEPPHTVERRIIKTDPGLRGDTAQGGTKPAVIEGNVTVTVPLFVNEGEVIRVDTRSGEYIERVSN